MTRSLRPVFDFELLTPKFVVALWVRWMGPNFLDSQAREDWLSVRKRASVWMPEGR